MTKGFDWINDFDWLALAACRGAPPELFYDDPLPFDEPPNEAGILAARRICSVCPVRAECAEQALHEEQGQSIEFRDGIRAWLTPAQRHSIEKRGGLHGADPQLLVEGWDNIKEREVPPIPDEGDKWTRHHTTLAHKLLRWLAKNVGEGEYLPPMTTICSAIAGCKMGTLRRVLDALVADGTLDLEGDPEMRVGNNGRQRRYVRNAVPRAIRSWQPIHLRPLESQ